MITNPPGASPANGPDYDLIVETTRPDSSYFPQLDVSGLSPLKAGLISSIPGLIGGGLSALSQFATNEINYRRQIDMYKENREYNSPKSQMERFKEAGLNPNLIYGQTNTAQAMPVGNSVAPNFDFLGMVSQNGLQSYNTQTSSNLANAINYVKYAVDRVNLGWLPEEKFQLWRKLKKTISNLDWDILNKHEDAWLKSLEYKLKDLNFNYDYQQMEKGFAPDLPAEYRMVIGMFSQLLDYLGIIDSKTFNSFINQTN